MAAANDASSASAASHHQAMANAVSCDQNADYAVICSFFEQFGDKSGLLFPSFQDLKVMLENTDEGQYCLGWPFEPVVPWRSNANFVFVLFHFSGLPPDRTACQTNAETEEDGQLQPMGEISHQLCPFILTTRRMGIRKIWIQEDGHWRETQAA